MTDLVVMQYGDEGTNYQQELQSAHLYSLSSSKVLSSKMRCLKTPVWGLCECSAVIHPSVAWVLSCIPYACSVQALMIQFHPFRSQHTPFLKVAGLKHRHRDLNIATPYTTINAPIRIWCLVLRLDGGWMGCRWEVFRLCNTWQQNCVERSIWSDWHGDCSCKGV